MARHPDPLSIPATIVPRGPARRGGGRGGLPGRRGAPPPDALAGLTASATGAFGGSDTLLTTELADLLTVAAEPFAAVGLALYPSRTAGPEIDELHPGGRQRQSAVGTEAPVPPPPGPPLPGLSPPVEPEVRLGEEFTPSPPAEALPGFAPEAPQATVLPGRPAEADATIIVRHEGDDGSSRRNSRRARNSGRVADPAVTQALSDTEWRAHHLINLAAPRAASELIAEAAKAGWRTDDAPNIAPLPASPEAQRKLKAVGIDRPVHDSGHRSWNADVESRLGRIEKELREEGYARGSDAYARRAREKLEDLQNELRRALIGHKRLTRLDTIDADMPA